MQVFVPYIKVINTARCLDYRRLNKQIIECNQIIDAIEGRSKAWKNHPVVKMYTPHLIWLYHYRACLIAWKDYVAFSIPREFKKESLQRVKDISYQASFIRPKFLTIKFCNQHKRRLFTKDPKRYEKFRKYGTSQENWYFVNGKIVKYINGKIVK